MINVFKTPQQIASNHGKLKSHAERLSNIKPSIN